MREASGGGRPVGVLADLQGPKIRLGRFANGKESWSPAPRSPSPSTTSRHRRPVLDDLQGLPGDVAPGDVILIDDGRLKLEGSR